MTRVVSVELIELDDPVDVFDIEVEHDHSFVIGEAVLHNSAICRGYSGKVWDLDGKPIGHSLPFNGGPPRHFRCRSVLVAWMKEFDELPDGTRRKIPEATQASMDGQIPADIDYEQFLRGKSETFQKEVLGPGKWELWKTGRITTADMIDQTGRELTLAELRKKFGV
jgi:hypothetical protein